LVEQIRHVSFLKSLQPHPAVLTQHSLRFFLLCGL
jgi:hypothetical protein